MRTRRFALLGALLATLAAPALSHSPHDVVDAVALSPDYANDRTLFVASAGSINVFLVSRDGGVTWRQARNGLRGVYVKRVRFLSDYVASGELLVMTDAGFQLSVDRGASWRRTDLGHRWLVDCASSPVRPADRALALFYGTGSVLWRSDDRGHSEQRLAPPLAGAQIVSIAVSPDFWMDATVVVTTDDGRLLKSEDGGASWTVTALGWAGRHVAFSGHFGTDRRLWIATWGGGVLASQDGGATFTPSGTSLTDPFANELSLVDALTPGADPTVMFVGTRDLGLFESHDAGATWTLTSLQPLRSTQTTNHFLHVDASRTWAVDSTVACGTFEGLFLSTDAGVTWTEAIINPTRAGRLVAIPATFADDDTVLGAGYGMPLIRTQTRGDRWELIWRGLVANTMYALGPSARFADDHMILVGGGSIVGGSTTIYRSTDAGGQFLVTYLPPHPAQWDPWGDGTGAEIKSIVYSPDFAHDQTVFALTHIGVLYRSTDAGAHWTLHGEPMETTDCWTKQVVLSPEFATTREMFVVGTGIFHSRDGGATFVEVHPGNFVNLALPADFATTPEGYVTTRDGVFGILTGGGATFTESTDGLEGFTVHAIAPSPDIAQDGTILVATSGGGIFESTDRGRHWARISPAGSVADAVLSFAMSPQFHVDRTLFAGTYSGHARSTDGGRSWRVVTEFDVYDEARDPWTLTGTWSSIVDPAAMKMEVRTSNVVGSTAELRFVGHGIELFGPAGPDKGIADVRIDGVSAALVDTYRRTAEVRASLFAQRLPFGPHVLQVVVTGTKHRLSRATTIGIDSAIVGYGTTGSYLAIGSGCPSSTGRVPSNTAVGADPAFGETFHVAIENVPTTGAACALILGLDEIAGLHLDLYGAPGCTVFTDALDVVPATIEPSGTASTDLVFPPLPELVGAVLFTQPILLDAPANPLGVVVGDARRAFVGLPAGD